VSDAGESEKEGEHGDIDYQEAPSMTLRDILIQAVDATHFDLLGMILPISLSDPLIMNSVL
jgi:hypothetical protein